MFSLWPKHELYDSVITVAIKWAANEDNRKETVINILNDLPPTSISDGYLENYLSKNEFIQNSIGCNKSIIRLYNEKFTLLTLKNAEAEAILKSENEKLKLKQTETEAKLKAAESEYELKFNKFLYNQPIILMAYGNNDTSMFYKYNRRDNALYFYNQLSAASYPTIDCKTYKNYIYVAGQNYCQRFAFDEPNQNSYESVFNHEHGHEFRIAVLNDSMHIFGSSDSTSRKKGSSIDLITNQTTSFNLLYDRQKPGVAVSG